MSAASPPSSFSCRAQTVTACLACSCLSTSHASWSFTSTATPRTSAVAMHSATPCASSSRSTFSPWSILVMEYVPAKPTRTASWPTLWQQCDSHWRRSNGSATTSCCSAGPWVRRRRLRWLRSTMLLGLYSSALSLAYARLSGAFLGSWRTRLASASTTVHSPPQSRSRRSWCMGRKTSLCPSNTARRYTRPCAVGRCWSAPRRWGITLHCCKMSGRSFFR
mmetsp:Transcript_34929/g.96498  ORF Transcript_34929/g.96498 Transcript_34929/m.96498 type:complete len:221 (+) Transcript_34929:143-805(+)